MENIKPQIEYNHLMECCCIFEAFNLERYFELTEELYSLKSVLDHLILTSQGYLSFGDEGILYPI